MNKENEFKKMILTSDEIKRIKSNLKGRILGDFEKGSNKIINIISEKREEIKSKNVDEMQQDLNKELSIKVLGSPNLDAYVFNLYIDYPELIKKGICPECLEFCYYNDFVSPIEIQEYYFNGMCHFCQDKIFNS